MIGGPWPDWPPGSATACDLGLYSFNFDSVLYTVHTRVTNFERPLAVVLDTRRRKFFAQRPNMITLLSLFSY